jgi:DNA recombination protein RmuC
MTPLPRAKLAGVSPELIQPYLYIAVAGVASVLFGILVAMLALIYRRLGEGDVRKHLRNAVSVLQSGQQRLEKEMREEASRARLEAGETQVRSRDEHARTLKDFGETTSAAVARIATAQNQQLEAFSKQLGLLTQTNEKRLDKLRETVENQLRQLQQDNAKRLDEMRKTVDEKLQGTLERRLGESFKQVSDRLEQVHKGLGEMQTLASGVGDLKRVLTNVKIRGTWGEVQLESLLEQVLGPAQFSKNVAPKPGSADRVEFCINLPGRTDDGNEIVWLPIDAKFPQEDYQRLVAGQEAGDAEAVAQATKQLEIRIKTCAKDIRDKYISPPQTTDFAILFLPTEGLYAEIVRHPELTDTLQREFRVVVAGPTTLGALLNSLQMGFRTLAIEKRSSEVWKTLGTIKSEFGKFGEIIDKVQKKLQSASNEMDRAASKSRTIERKLRKVEALPTAETRDILEAANLDLDTSDDEDTEPESESAPDPELNPRDLDA